eukprot:TRINITY_DN4336_c0_g1_i1.p1 TRINITY_DN4336_c0_g1~~TRINITY_DN4336_c0_g1_i1.p1  ORF type:complete len:429 (+),score=67.95 TRINITY_DN4336_c0_g1_i1:352-1638(+)
MSTPRSLLWNNFLMSSCFAWAEGAITAILAISATLVEKDLYSQAGVVLYLAFGVGTLVAPAVVGALGLKRSLVVGLAGFSIFAVSFVHPVTPVMLTAAAISGFLGSVLWTAQGAYYTVNALEYAKAGGDTKKGSIGVMSSIFAGIFPLAMVVCKLLSSFVLQSSIGNPRLFVYLFYTMITVGAVCGMLFVKDLKTPDEFEKCGVADNVKETVKALGDVKMLLMVPTNVAFGLATSYFPVVVSSTVGDLHGAHMVGYLYAWAGAVSFVLAFLFTRVSNSLEHGRGVVMCVGGFCYTVVFASQWLVRSTTRPSLFLLFAFYGAANTVWQGTCMAVFSDYWHAHPLPAFANLKLHSGLASALGFALFPRASQPTPAILCLCASIIGVVCYLATVPIDTSYVLQPVQAKADEVQMASMELIQNDLPELEDTV